MNLTSNYYTWNKVANMLYIESPCGVGFSYGEYEDDYKSNDNVTAFDNYLFLDGFFAVSFFIFYFFIFIIVNYLFLFF